MRLGVCAVFGLVLLCAARVAIAQQAETNNAAYWYQRAIDQMESLPDDVQEAILLYMPGEQPTPELRNALRAAEPVFSALQRGAAQEYSDFHLDLSQGIDLLLPHLSPMRNCAKFLNAQAGVRMFDGDTMGAARDFGSMYNIGEHMSGDGTMISSLVGQAIFMFAERGVQDGIDRGAFDSAASAELYKSIERYDANDPFGYVEDLFGEQELMVSTMEKYFSDPNLTEETVGMLVGESPHIDDVFKEINEEGLDAQIQKIDAVLNDVTGIFMIEDEDEAKAQMAALETKIEAGEYGAMALLLMPAYGKIHERMLAGRKTLEERRAVLEKLAAGEIKPEEQLNAALIYKQAIDAWYAVDPAKRAAVLETAERSTDAIDEGVTGILTEATPVIDLMRRASQLKRCDFEALRRYEDLSLAPASVIGMNELLTVIRLDALRLAREKNGADAADRLAIGFRAIGHMSGDSVPTGSLVAHFAFNDLAAQLKAGLNADLYEDKRDDLRESVERIPQRDPFGYVNATMMTRKLVTGRLRWLMQSSGAAEEKPTDDVVRDWQGEKLMYIIAIIETMREKQRKESQASDQSGAADTGEQMYIPLPIDRIGTLDNVISIEAVKTAQTEADEFAAKLETGKLQFIDELTMPSIGDWDQRMLKARGDLRDARKLLMAEDAESNDVDATPPGE